MNRTKQDIINALDSIKDADIVYDVDSPDTTNINQSKISFSELEKLRLASAREYDASKKAIKDKKLSVKVTQNELDELKEFWGSNYTGKIRKFLLDFIHSQQEKHS